ncbi:MAG: hypothetical protein HY869_06120 [Chloroflexi bacterium]|nr:hypothetical protein [Chloroflexota bacterium]
MKYKNIVVSVILAITLIASFYLSRLGYVRIMTANQYAEELSALQTAQAGTEQDVKTLLGRQLAAQARRINIHDDSNQMLAVLLAVQSMNMLPTVEASQVLQYNLSAYETLRMKHDDSVLSAAFSPDGTFVATGSSDHFIRVWEMSTGKETLQMHHDDVVQAVAFSPDGKQIASASADHTIRVWDIPSGKEIVRMAQSGSKLFIAYSPNGKHIVSSGSDRIVHVWDASTGKEIAHFLHADSVTSVAFSPDNIHVATGSMDHTARVWDIVTGMEVAHVVHEKSVTAVAFSPDGKIVVSGSMDTTAKTWDATTGEGVAITLNEGERGAVSVIRCVAPVTSVAFSPDGKYIAIGSEESNIDWMSSEIAPTLNVWKVSLDNWDGYRISLSLRNDVTAVAFSPDGQYLLSSSEDNTARVWELVTGREISRMTHDDTVTSIAFGPDGRQVISSSLDHTARAWDVLPWQNIAQENHETPVLSIAFSPDSNYIASSDESGTILIRETGTDREVTRINLDAPPSESEDGLPFVYTPKTNPVFSIAFSPDGKYIVSGSFDNTVRIWDIKTGAEIERMSSGYGIENNYSDGIPRYSRGIYSVAYSTDSKFVVSGGQDGTIRVWEVKSGGEITRMKIEEPVYTVNYSYSNRVLAVNFSPDGKYIVSGSSDNTVRIWEISTGREIFRGLHYQKTHSIGRVNSVAFSPNGKYIISGGEDNVVHVWDAAVSGKEVFYIEHDYFIYSIMTKRYTAHGWGPSTEGNVFSVAFTPDGNYILSVSDDNTVGIWDVTTGQEISRIVHYINVFRDHLSSVAISPNGKYVASGDSHGQVNLWLWRPADLIADACSRLPRNLTREEWAEYIGDTLPYQAVCPNLPIE